MSGFDREELHQLFGNQAQLVTLDILYEVPDRKWLLQQFVWQTLDVIPGLPRIERFLDYWHHNIEAAIRELKVAAKDPGGRPVIFVPTFISTLH